MAKAKRHFTKAELQAAADLATATMQTEIDMAKIRRTPHGTSLSAKIHYVSRGATILRLTFVEEVKTSGIEAFDQYLDGLDSGSPEIERAFQNGMRAGFTNLGLEFKGLD